MEALRAARDRLYAAHGRGFEYEGDVGLLEVAKSVSDLAQRIVQDIEPSLPGPES